MSEPTSDPAIKISNLSKDFVSYDKPIKHLFRHLGLSPASIKFRALNDISLEIRKGEVVGIVGRNGSGKSTFLHLLSGTLSPTEGRIRTNGRIAALLELGAGFNPEFTGRENISLNGALMGRTANEIQEQMPKIIDFAELGDFLDKPLTTYSSGMLLRLAFSVAIHVEPDVLIIDEALSVGDEKFQRKCFSKIEEIKNSGTTILFVSHSSNAVIELCDRAVLFDRGEMLMVGDPKSVIGTYQKLIYANDNEYEGLRRHIKEQPTVSQSEESHLVKTETETDSQPEFYNPGFETSSDRVEYVQNGARISDPAITNSAGKKVNGLVRGCKYTLSYNVNFVKDSEYVLFGMMIKSITGVEIGGAASATKCLDGYQLISAGSSFSVNFGFTCSLNPGTYFLNCGVMGIENSEETYLHRLLDALMFQVVPITNKTETGYVDFDCQFQIEER